VIDAFAVPGNNHGVHFKSVVCCLISAFNSLILFVLSASIFYVSRKKAYEVAGSETGTTQYAE
jgi:hypothetical protein